MSIRKVSSFSDPLFELDDRHLHVRRILLRGASPMMFAWIEHKRDTARTVEEANERTVPMFSPVNHWCSRAEYQSVNYGELSLRNRRCSKVKTYIRALKRPEWKGLINVSARMIGERTRIGLTSPARIVCTISIGTVTQIAKTMRKYQKILCTKNEVFWRSLKRQSFLLRQINDENDFSSRVIFSWSNGSFVQ